MGRTLKEFPAVDDARGDFEGDNVALWTVSSSVNLHFPRSCCNIRKGDSQAYLRFVQKLDRDTDCAG